MEANAYSADECAAAAAALVRWFRLETWTLQEGFLLLSGFDPHRTTVGFDIEKRQVTSYESLPSYRVIGAGTGGRWDLGPRRAMLPIDVGEFSPRREVDQLVELMDVWRSRVVPQKVVLAPPMYFVEWAESKGLAPFWLPAVRQRVAQAVPARGWPWGSHDTAALRELAAAASHFWANYDPSEPDTAPTNDVVSDWLYARTKSRRLADAMASILRADGLPHGRR